MVNNPLIRPYFLGGGGSQGGWALRFPSAIQTSLASQIQLFLDEIIFLFSILGKQKKHKYTSTFQGVPIKP